MLLMLLLLLMLFFYVIVVDVLMMLLFIMLLLIMTDFLCFPMGTYETEAHFFFSHIAAISGFLMTSATTRIILSFVILNCVLIST